MVVNGGVRFFVAVSRCYLNFLECHLLTRGNVLLLVKPVTRVPRLRSISRVRSFCSEQSGAERLAFFERFLITLDGKVELFVKRSNYKRKLSEAA